MDWNKQNPFKRCKISKLTLNFNKNKYKYEYE